MSKASDAPLIEASISVYTSIETHLNGMRRHTDDVAELLAIASVADDVGTRISGMRMRLKKLAVSAGALDPERRTARPVALFPGAIPA